ncbi:hypothetical protein [Desulfocicer vacuolatum]|nr:hypothetical protein [Desulfocicer vacuolatum]
MGGAPGRLKRLVRLIPQTKEHIKGDLKWTPLYLEHGSLITGHRTQ